MQYFRLLVLLLQLFHLLHGCPSNLDILFMAVSAPDAILFGYFLAGQALPLELSPPHSFLEAGHVEVMLAVGFNHCSVLIADITFMILILGLPPHCGQLWRRQGLLFLAAAEILHREKQDNQ